MAESWEFSSVHTLVALAALALGCHWTCHWSVGVNVVPRHSFTPKLLDYGTATDGTLGGIDMSELDVHMSAGCEEGQECEVCRR